MKFLCPNCRLKLEGEGSFAGSGIDCPGCGHRFEIPAIGDDDTAPIVPPGTPANVAETTPEEKYIFHGEIARGGMGKIVSATDRNLDRPVVFKQLIDPDEDKVLVNQLIREAQITARLSHPGIVPIHELDHTDDGRIYYTMKHIRGEPLDSVLDKLRRDDPDMIEKSPFQRLLIIFSRVCNTIGYANEMGIIHRDIKPDNIMLAPYGEYLIIDWGIAKDLNDQTDFHKTIASAFRYIPEAGEYGATLHGSIFGSPSYMSPEQARGEIDSIDARSDVFSLGALLFELLTLSPPFEGETPEAAVDNAANRNIKLISEIRRERPNQLNPWPHIEGGELPESILAVAMKAMQMNPDDRYQSAVELRLEIDAYLAGKTTAAENAGFFKMIQSAANRHKRMAGTVAFGLILATATIFSMANLNRKVTEKALLARQEAEGYISKANEARVARQNTRLKVAPSYLEMAHQFANRGDAASALDLARLAAEYDPGLIEAAALVTALEIHTLVNSGEGQITSRNFISKFPSLAFLVANRGVLSTVISEQTYARLSMAYSEVGLTRFAGEIIAEQAGRLDQYREKLTEACEGCDAVWDLSLVSEMSSLCLNDETQSCFPDYTKWAAKIDPLYPGDLLHLEISSARKLPDLSILADLAIESLTIHEGVPVAVEQLQKLKRCRSLKVVSLFSGSFGDLSFLAGLPLVSIIINNQSPVIDLTALNGCNSLRVLVTGLENRLSSLSFLPRGRLQIFSGRTIDGNYNSLAGMPLQFLKINPVGEAVNISGLRYLPVRSFIAEGIDLQRHWETISAWPLKLLSIDSPFDVDTAKLNRSMSGLSYLYIRDGQWIGSAEQVFPSLRHLFDENGKNFARFAAIDTLKSIQIDGSRDGICYLSCLERIPAGIDLHISPDMPVQVLPENIAMHLVNEDWEQAAKDYELLLGSVESQPMLTSALRRTKQLGAVISNQADPGGYFISKKAVHTGRVFQIIYCGLTCEKAKIFAKQAGGKLATIESPEDIEFLKGLISSQPGPKAFWIAGECRALRFGKDEIITRPHDCVYPFVIEW